MSVGGCNFGRGGGVHGKAALTEARALSCLFGCFRFGGQPYLDVFDPLTGTCAVKACRITVFGFFFRVLCRYTHLRFESLW